MVRDVRWVERGGWVGCFRRWGFVEVEIGTSWVDGDGDGGVRSVDSVRSVLIRWVERRGLMVGRADWKVDRSSERRSSVSVGRGWDGSHWREVER